MKNNKGFDTAEIAKFKAELSKKGELYKIVDTEDNNDEYVNFNFIGKHEGNEVIFDAVIYTLRLHHQSELYEEAEQRAADKYPEFKKIRAKAGDNGEYDMPEQLEEEVGIFMSEVMDEMEEEETIKVQEHVEIDDEVEYGVGLDAGLNVPEIPPEVITKFINDFNAGSLQLDDTLYSFQHSDEE